MSKKKYGVLLVNLGTPANPTTGAVRQFLKEFLSDKRVVDAPRLIWIPVLYGIILTFRPARVAKNYQKIWLDSGSPLMVYSKSQQSKLQQLLDESDQHHFKVALGMTYGSPSIEAAASELEDWGADEVIVLPLYPQFSFTTTAPVTDQLARLKSFAENRYRVINDYHDDTHYIQALADSIRPKMRAGAKLVMSFHGIPKRYVKQGDPYLAQSEVTAKKLAATLELSETEWEMAFQSRVGREEWLTPYLDQRMAQLPTEGTKNVVLVTPGFSCDCLETLEEVAMENKEIFLEAGGESFEYVAALNDSPAHIQMMARLIESQILTAQ